MVGVSACYHPDSTVSHGLRGEGGGGGGGDGGAK